MLARGQRKESHGGRPIQAMVRVGGVTERLSFVPNVAISRFFVSGHVLFVSLHGGYRFSANEGEYRTLGDPLAWENLPSMTLKLWKVRIEATNWVGEKGRVGGKSVGQRELTPEKCRYQF
jgi:hypothetical protein